MKRRKFFKNLSIAVTGIAITKTIPKEEITALPSRLHELDEIGYTFNTAEYIEMQLKYIEAITGVPKRILVNE